MKKADLNNYDLIKKKLPYSLMSDEYIGCIAGRAGSAALDRFASEEAGIPSPVLMERAAQYTAQVILGVFGIPPEDRSYIPAGPAGKPEKLRIVFFCGNGNNGGDGVACARILSDYKAFETDVYIVNNGSELRDSVNSQVNILNAVSGRDTYCTYINERSMPIMKDGCGTPDLIVDALFGTGLSGKITGFNDMVVDEINCTDSPVLSIDIPSGIMSDTGEVAGRAVKADITVTMGMMKYGLMFEPGRQYAGRIIIAPGVFPKNIVPRMIREKYGHSEDIARYGLDRNTVSRLRKGIAGTNKGTFGRILVIAGSKNISGAAFLSAAAAYTAGAGLVKVVTHENNADMIRTRLPEALLRVYDDSTPECSIINNDEISRADVILCGPGIGTGMMAEAAVEKLLDVKDKPVILDADALNIISSSGMLDRVGKNVILTPHMKEFERLTGISVSNTKKNMIRAAESIKGPVLVLKDYVTLVQREDEEHRLRYVNPTGNQALSTGGSGDTLAGIIAGLAALFIHEYGMDGKKKEGVKKDPLFLAAAYGVNIHGYAADLYVREHPAASMLAGDIITYLKSAEICR